jgi:hypothetical protein
MTVRPVLLFEYADYLGALQRYRIRHPRDPHLLAASSFLLDYPFANRLFTGSLDAIEHIADLVDYDLPALLGASRAKEAR